MKRVLLITTVATMTSVAAFAGNLAMEVPHGFNQGRELSTDIKYVSNFGKPLDLAPMKTTQMAPQKEQIVAEVKKEIQAAPPSRIIENRRLNFAINSAQVSSNAQSELAEIAAALKANSKLAVKVEGHTDATGDREKNLKLSLARAQAVKAELLKLGVSENQILPEAQGSKEVIDTTNHAANRRVEVKILQ